MTTWSRVTRLGPVFSSMKDELLVVECEDGRPRFDVPDAPYVDGDAPAPVRLLGAYDNAWLSHAKRGTSWLRDGRVVTDVFRRLTKPETADLEAEVAAVEMLLAH